MAKIKDSENGKFIVSHGLCDTPTYHTWEAMKSRCLKPQDKQYPEYGGRGITICEKWLTFEGFLADMGEKPEPDMQIDRIDNNSGYYLDNCRWVTKQENARNRRTSKRWYVLGKWYETAKEAGEMLGRTESTIIRWCEGYKTNQGNWMEPRPECYSVPLYGFTSGQALG